MDAEETPHTARTWLETATAQKKRDTERDPETLHEQKTTLDQNESGIVVPIHKNGLGVVVAFTLEGLLIIENANSGLAIEMNTYHLNCQHSAWCPLPAIGSQGPLVPGRVIVSADGHVFSHHSDAENERILSDLVTKTELTLKIDTGGAYLQKLLETGMIRNLFKVIIC